MDIEDAFLAETMAEMEVGLTDQEEEELTKFLIELFTTRAENAPDGDLTLEMITTIAETAFVAGRAYQAGRGETFPVNMSRAMLYEFMEYLANKSQQ